MQMLGARGVCALESYSYRMMYMHQYASLCTVMHYVAININYPPHGICMEQHRGFSYIIHQILPQERGISLFSGTVRIKKHTDTLTKNDV